MRLLPLHVDEVKLLHPDVCVDVKQLVKLADLRKRREVGWQRALNSLADHTLTYTYVSFRLVQLRVQRTRHAVNRTLKNRTVSMFSLLNFHH